MSGFAVGDTVRVLAPSFAEPTGTVTEIDNGHTVLTVSVRLENGQQWVFAPDELELISNEQ